MVLLLLMVELLIDYFIQTFLSSGIFFDILFPNIFADFCSSIVFQFFSHSTWVLVVATPFFFTQTVNGKCPLACLNGDTAI